MKASQGAEKHLHHFERAISAFMASGASAQDKVLARMAYDECELRMSSRMTSSAGYAQWRNSLFLNSPLKVRDLKVKLSTPLTDRSTSEQLFQTCSHELAHVIDAALNGSSSHGSRWRRINIQMGGDGKRCHAISTAGLKKPRKRLVLRHKVNGQEFRVPPRRWKSEGWLVCYYSVVREIMIDEHGREISPVTKAVASAAAKVEPKAASKQKASKKTRERVSTPDTIECIPSDEYCWTAARANGGHMSWKGIEDAHGLHPANGMTAYRLAQKYKKRMGF